MTMTSLSDDVRAEYWATAGSVIDDHNLPTCTPKVEGLLIACMTASVEPAEEDAAIFADWINRRTAPVNEAHRLFPDAGEDFDCNTCGGMLLHPKAPAEGLSAEEMSAGKMPSSYYRAVHLGWYKHGEPSAKEVAEIKKLHARGVPVKEIVRKVNRTNGTVVAAIAQ